MKRFTKIGTSSMRTFIPSALIVAVTAGVAAAEPPPGDAYVIDTRSSPHVQLQPLPFDAVRWTSGFWADRFRQLTDVTLGVSWDLLADPEQGHVLQNFRSAAAGGGPYEGTHWQDEWLYKWIEGASCVWSVTRDPRIERRMMEGIALIAAAQQPDGYISTNVIARRNQRYADARAHEFYNMGHLLTAGVVHRRMTGNESLFRVAKKTGDFICATLGVTVEPYFAHNPSAIMGLIELYRETGEKKYLETAKLIVDRRGATPKRQSLFDMTPGIGGTDLIQDRVPIRESREVVGHNVFFTYLYTGAADAYAETGDAALMTGLERLWADMTSRKMYIHGGVSAVARGLSNDAPVVEAAGPAYMLPNAECYNETCGQIGVFMWAWRMLAARPDSQFADVMEREMYNGFLGAASLEGDHWFYRNVIRRYDREHKSKGWTDMAARGQPGRRQICCPSNLLRTIAELTSYFYSTDSLGLWVHQYGGSSVKVKRPHGGELVFEQVTDYPWNGDVKFVIQEAPTEPVALRLRVPDWADRSGIRIDGRPLGDFSVERGYVTVSRSWKRGDTLKLELPMPARLVAANPAVEETRNQAAVMRGPVLYCVESPDLPAGVAVPVVYLPLRPDFAPTPGVGGVSGELAASAVSLRGKGLRLVESDWRETLYRNFEGGTFEPFPLTVVPYFAWANRGPSAMSVWIPVAVGH